MLRSQVFLLLLVTTATVLTMFTASVTFSSTTASLLGYLPILRERLKPEPFWTTAIQNIGPEIDYNDVDFLSNELEHQIIQILGNEVDSVHKMEDIYPGKMGNRGSQEKRGVFAKGKMPYLRSRTITVQTILRRKIDSWQLEIFGNTMFRPFWPKMRSLLKNWTDNRQFEPQILQRLLLSVKQPIDESSERLRHDMVLHPKNRYRTCAVVGNSGILLNSSHGAAIDEHEMVMRINCARTAGFENSVGRKTTISFMNSHILRACAKRTQCWCHPYGANVPIITYICAPWHFMPISFCSSEHSASLLVTDPRFDNVCNRIAKWYSVKLFRRKPNVKPEWWTTLRNPARQFHYSTGMQGVVMALGLCESIHIYGFGKAVGLKHHYFSQQQQELKDIHDYNAEYEFYRDLEQRNVDVIPFFKAAGITNLPSFQVMA